jgi:hypothetical protein
VLGVRFFPRKSCFINIVSLNPVLVVCYYVDGRYTIVVVYCQALFTIVFICDCMKWNQEVFYNNIMLLINGYCAGNATSFNKKIKSRDAATRWRTKKPTLKALSTIMDVFNVTLEWLVTDHGGTKAAAVLELMSPSASAGLQEVLIARLSVDLARAEEHIAALQKRCNAVEEVLSRYEIRFSEIEAKIQQNIAVKKDDGEASDVL